MTEIELIELIEVVPRDEGNLQCVPKGLQTAELWDATLREHPEALEYVNDYSYVLGRVKENPDSFGLTKESLRDYQLSLIAIRDNPQQLGRVPWEIRKVNNCELSWMALDGVNDSHEQSRVGSEFPGICLQD